MTKEFLLISDKNNKLRITAYGVENCSNSPLIIFVHGFKGFKDWGFCPFLAQQLAAEGFFVITFNFSHNGTGDSLTEFVELDKFSENTFSLEVSELSDIINAYKNGFFGNTKVNSIGLLGHSRGGAISVLTAKLFDEVKAVALWASVSTLDRYSESQIEKWKRTGVFELLNVRTKQVMSLNYTLYEDLEKYKDDLLNIEKSVKELNRPLLIIHGEQDLAVPYSEAEQLYDWSDKEKTKLVKISDTGHTFDMVHPFAGTNNKFNNVINFTKSFFRKNLIEEKMSVKEIAIPQRFMNVLSSSYAKVFLFTLLTTIAAQIAVPVKPVPFTLQTMAVVLAGAFLGAKKGAYSQLLYLALGAIGLPVFAQVPDAAFGFARLLSPTGGYLLAFPIAAYVVGDMIERKNSYFASTLAMFVGNLIIIASGTAFLFTFYVKDADLAVAAGAGLFSLWTVVKVFVASSIFWKIKK